MGLAADIEAWRTLLDQHWNEIRFVDYSVETGVGPEGDARQVSVQVELGHVPPGAILVELYAEPQEGDIPERHVLITDVGSLKKGARSPGSYTFRAALPALRPVGDYTPRVVPWHRSARVPLESGHILWYR
jgi:starch phosphorylase